VNSNVHGTTHEIPLDRLKLEELKPIDGVSEYLVFVKKPERYLEIALFHTLEPILRTISICRQRGYTYDI